jgi:hypothetical protein
MKRSETNSEDSASEGIQSIQKAKSKLIMDFGLDQSAPERVTIEVLQQLIKEKPERMCKAARRWLSNQRPEN